MSAPNYNSLLDRTVGSAERPKALPIGTYTGIIAEMGFGESAKKKTPYVRYTVRPLQAVSGVDPDMFAAAGGAERMAKMKLALDFYLTEDAMWRLREFLEESLRIDCTTRSFKEAIPYATNQRITFTMDVQVSDDGKASYNQIKNVLKPAEIATLRPRPQPLSKRQVNRKGGSLEEILPSSICQWYQPTPSGRIPICPAHTGMGRSSSRGACI
jgi:hypothetical protein